MLNQITYKELIEVIHNYIKTYYGYESCNVFDDNLIYTLENGKEVSVYLTIDTE